MKWLTKILEKLKLAREIDRERKEILRKALLHKTRGQQYLVPATEVVGNFAREEALEVLKIQGMVNVAVSHDLFMRIILTESGTEEALKLVGRK